MEPQGVLGIEVTPVAIGQLPKHFQRGLIGWLVTFVDKIARRALRIGALVTAALFRRGKSVIGLYPGNSAVASSFGAAGSVIALLLWVYYSAQIFFLGAQFTGQYALRIGSLQRMRH